MSSSINVSSSCRRIEKRNMEAKTQLWLIQKYKIEKQFNGLHQTQLQWRQSLILDKLWHKIGASVLLDHSISFLWKRKNYAGDNMFPETHSSIRISDLARKGSGHSCSNMPRLLRSEAKRPRSFKSSVSHRTRNASGNMVGLLEGRITLCVTPPVPNVTQRIPCDIFQN